jgi:hypothetical protein
MFAMKVQSLAFFSRRAESVLGRRCPGRRQLPHPCVRPYTLVIRRPTLGAVKSSEKAPLSALKLAALAKEAGVPDGVLSVISGAGPTGAALAQHMRIRKVHSSVHGRRRWLTQAQIAFTGSARTGKLVSRMATESNLKAVRSRVPALDRVS